MLKRRQPETVCDLVLLLVSNLKAPCEIFIKIKKPLRFPGAALELSEVDYFFFALAFALRFSSMAACAAAKRATGTRYGEQLT